MDDFIETTPDNTPEDAREDWTEKRDYTPASHWGAPEEPEVPRFLGL